MADERSLFERLDSIEETNKANNRILEQLLGALNKEQAQFTTQQDQAPRMSEKDILLKFLREAKKSLRWFGTKYEFKKSKYLAIIANIALIAIGIVASIISTISFRMYSTFTLFENIWIIFGIVTLSFLFHNQLTNEVNDLARHSPSKYQRDEVGMLYPTNTKLPFRIFKWLSIISVACNIICIWAGMSKDTKILATIMEVLYFGAMVFALITTSNFYLMYSIPWVEGHSLTTKQRVVLVLPPGEKQLMTEEDFRTKFPIFYE